MQQQKKRKVKIICRNQKQKQQKTKREKINKQQNNNQSLCRIHHTTKVCVNTCVGIIAKLLNCQKNS